jgi:NADPH2:quinone reductase
MVPNIAFPMISGRDFAGIVDAIGPGVTTWKIGDAVWGANQAVGNRPGSWAEYTLAQAEWLYRMPRGQTAAEVASWALVGITAHIGLIQKARIQPGEWVFVNGGAGGVGSAVIQVAKAVGAKVFATVSSAEKRAIATKLGADVVVNYTTEDVDSQIRTATAGRGVDVWFETIPPTDLERTFQLTAAKGRIIVMAGRGAKPTFPNGLFYLRELSLFGFAMFNNTASELQTAADALNQLAESGRFHANIGQRFPLTDAVAAHQLQEANTLHRAGTLSGKIVIELEG